LSANLDPVHGLEQSGQSITRPSFVIHNDQPHHQFLSRFHFAAGACNPVTHMPAKHAGGKNHASGLYCAEP
jgi:hypothetical protein